MATHNPHREVPQGLENRVLSLFSIRIKIIFNDGRGDSSHFDVAWKKMGEEPFRDYSLRGDKRLRLAKRKAADILTLSIDKQVKFLSDYYKKVEQAFDIIEQSKRLRSLPYSKRPHFYQDDKIILAADEKDAGIKAGVYYYIRNLHKGFYIHVNLFANPFGLETLEGMKITCSVSPTEYLPKYRIRP